MGWAFIISVGGILKSEVGRFFLDFVVCYTKVVLRL